jgi:hypothetical protein
MQAKPEDRQATLWLLQVIKPLYMPIGIPTIDF